MSTNRAFYMPMFLAIALAFAIALDPAIVTRAAGQARSTQSSSRGLTGLSAHAYALNDEKQADR